MELHEVTARHLAPVISRVTAEHGRPSGLAAFRSLSAMFGLAERWGYIEMNPFRRMQAPTVPKPGSTVLVGADRAVDTQKVPSCMGE